MLDCLKFLPCLVAILFAACSTHIAGTTEEPNALANDVSSSSESSSSSAPGSSSSGTEQSAEHDVMYEPYWLPYWGDSVDPDQVDVEIEAETGGSITVSFRSRAVVGAPDSTGATSFGVAIRVAGEGPDVFSEMKTWTSGACYMATSDVPVVLKMGMSPEKERELEYDLPQATLIGPGEVGGVVIRCVSWLDFEQQGFGPSITIEEAFFDYMTELRFEMQPEGYDSEGSLKISQIRKGGTGIDANVDGMDVYLKDGE